MRGEKRKKGRGKKGGGGGREEDMKIVDIGGKERKL